MVQGVVVGVAAALIEAFWRAMQPHWSLIARQAGDRMYEPFTVDAVKRPTICSSIASAPGCHTVVVNADALGVPDASARECLDKARRELEASGIRLAFGNVRADLRAALKKIGAFTVLDEGEFVADLRKVRSDRP